MEDAGGRSVLVIETLGAPPPPRRRRRQARPIDEAPSPAELPLARVTVVHAGQPLADEPAAASWAHGVAEDEERVDSEAGAAVGLINRALHAQALAAGEAHEPSVSLAEASAARVGYGSGEALAEGRFSHAIEVETSRGSRGRRRRDQQLAPQRRLAAILSGREQPAACESLVLRARRDLDAGRVREAALQLAPAVGALLAELGDAVDDDGHRRDIAELRERRPAIESAARAALHGDLSEADAREVDEVLATCERVLRRRRVLES